MNKLIDDEKRTQFGCDLSNEFIELLKPLLEKYREYSTIDIEHILIAEINRQLFLLSVDKCAKKKNKRIRRKNFLYY